MFKKFLDIYLLPMIFIVLIGVMLLILRFTIFRAMSEKTINNDPVTYVTELYSDGTTNMEYFYKTMEHTYADSSTMYISLFARFEMESPKLVILEQGSGYVLYKFKNRFIDPLNTYKMQFTFDTKGNIVTAKETEIE